MGEKQEITAYKAFDKNLQCRGFQYEVGQTYTHDGKVQACESGFHSCENPLDVLNYYDLIDSRFAVVKVGGDISKDGDTKIASATITIEAELKLPEFIKAAVNWIMAACKAGDDVQAASGNYSQLAASGNYSQLAASGDYSKLAASGDYSQLAASGNSSQLAASGDYSKLAASGDSSIAVASGLRSIAKAGKDGCIVLTRWVDSEKRFRASVDYVGEGLDQDQWYGLDDAGNFVKVEV